MTLRIRSIAIDCADPCLLAGFWSQVTGFHEDPANPNLPADPEGLLHAPDGSVSLLFMRVPEPRRGKNRVHLDLMPAAGHESHRRDEEISRLLGLGAGLVADHRQPDGTGWVVLADPEGNEFCVERGRPGG